ncbi:MAG: M48 family metallopeptidase [Thermoproteota archaeon]
MKKLTSLRKVEEEQANILYDRLSKIYNEIEKEGKIKIFGNLDFEVVKKIDGKRERIAKLKGNKIVVKISAVSLPDSALKYIIAHEIAHILLKRHTKRFWKIVETIYPDFKVGQRELAEYSKFLV